MDLNDDSNTTPLYCLVCGDSAHGKHYGIVSCEGCRGFFKRVHQQLTRPIFPCRGNQNCVITKIDRNRCQYCRYKKCLECGMTSDPLSPDSNTVPKSSKRPKNYLNKSKKSAYPVPVQCLNADLSNNDSSTDSKYPEYKGPIMGDEHVLFKAPVPESVPTHFDIDYICETGSKLLILSLHWAKNIPAFQSLSSKDQVIVLQTYWAELFVLALAQCSETLSISLLLSSLFSMVQDKTEPKILEDNIIKLQDFVDCMNTLRVNDHEYAYLKAISLFSSDKLDRLDKQPIEQLQEKSFQTLRSYVGDDDRLARLLLRLPALRSIDSKALEDLFFCDLFDEVQVDTVIPHIFKMENVSLPSGSLNVDTISAHRVEL